MELKKEFEKLEPVKELLEKLGYNNIVFDVEMKSPYPDFKRIEVKIQASRIDT